jgi:hypothetical protein
MGKDFHYTILPFIEKALDGHDKVKMFRKEETDENIFYSIKRYGKSDIRIWISDTYIFTINDYFQKPKGIDFIYIAKPEAKYNQDEVVEAAYRDGINIGKFGALMGVLYVNDIKKYIPKERRDNE